MDSHMIDADGKPVDRQEAIAGYLRHAEAAPAESADFWAWDAVIRFVRLAPADEGWDLVIELLHRAPDTVLGNIAAGPLEDLVRKHGAVLVEWIEGQAHTDVRFRSALGRIWLTRGVLPLPVETRIVAASGNQILLLDGSEASR
jgi:hypothetical protein